MSKFNNQSKKANEKKQDNKEKERSTLVQTASSVKDAMKDSFKKRSFQSVGVKLFSIIFVSILACVLTVGLLAYSQAKNLVEDNVSKASLQTVKQVTNNLNTIFKTYEDMSLQILIDKNISDGIGNLGKSTDAYQALMSSNTVSSSLESYLMGNSTIAGIALVPIEKGKPIITVGNAIASKVEALIETDIMKATIESEGRITWIEPQPDGITVANGKPSIALTRLLRNVSSTNNSYILVIEIPIQTLMDSYNEVELGEGSELAIVNSEGINVVANDETTIGQPASVSSLAEQSEEESNQFKSSTTGGEAVLVVYDSFDSSSWKLVGTIPVNELVKDAEVIRNLTWITAAIAGLLAIAIGYMVIVTIAKPLVNLCGLMEKGARGNLTVRATVGKRRDEIGQLGESFNQMMIQIKELAVQTTSSAADVLRTSSDLTDASMKTALAAKEIAVATEEIANGATSLAVEAEKGSDLTSSINSQMREVMDANDEMSQAAIEVEKASGQGTAYMGVLMEKTGMTEEMTRSMVEKVDALKESTGSIVKILDVLDSIMKQTNILSLNATIEAARAGEAGRGFMVVADEIRKLADESRQSIIVVGQITEKIRQEVEETVKVLLDAYPLFQEQIGSVKEANQIFITVQGQMGQFVEKLGSVTGSIKLLDQSQTVLADAMTNVSAVAEESSATSEEVASLSSEQLSISDGLVQLSEKLDSVSKGLKETLSKFIIE